MRKISPIFLLFIILFFLPLVLTAQNKRIDSLLSILQTAKEDTNKVKTLHMLGGLLRNTPDEAIKYSYEAIALSKKINYKNGEAKSYGHLTQLYTDKKDLAKAEEYLEKAILLFEEIKNTEGIAITHMNMGVNYGKFGKSDQALKEYFTALSLFESMDRNDGIAFCANNIGSIYQRLGNPKQALKYHQMSLEARKIMGINRDLIMSYKNIGSVYQDQGDYAEALRNFLIALKTAEETNDKFWIAETYVSLGSCYFYQENYEKAFEYFTKNLMIVQKVGDKRRMADAYNNIGNISIKQEKYQEALQNHEKALNIRKEVDDKFGISASYLNIGAVYMEQERHDEALKNLFQAAKIKEEIRDQNGLAMTFNNIGKIYTKQHKFEEAALYLTKSLDISKQSNNKELIFSAYSTLVFLDSTSGNFANAYVNYKNATLYKDSLENKEVTEQITRLQMQYEFDKKEDSLKYQQALTDEKLQQQTLLSKQQQQSLLLKENELSLANSESEIQRLAHLQTQSELQIEQSKRSENEKQLLISTQEKNLQSVQLQLQQNDLRQKKNQRNIFITGTVALLLLVFFIFRNFQSQRKANKFMQAAAEKQMVEMQLENLRAQLNPHFMFNSLNAIQELIVTDKTELSQSYLERFAKLLRMLLENASHPFIPLRKEINFLELYLSLENLRIPDLKYSIRVDPNVNTEETLTPNMMLQPHIENSLWHGLQHKQGEKTLQLHITRENGSINYSVKDNGVGRKKAEELKSLYRKEHRSKGMELLSKRFSLLSKEYGQDIKTEINDLMENGEPTGTVVKISVPSTLPVLN